MATVALAYRRRRRGQPYGPAAGGRGAGAGAVVSDALLFTAIAAGTALVTGVGALPVIALGGERARAWQGVLSGLTAGVMAVAAIVGLLIPAAEQVATITVAGATLGAALMLALGLALEV